MDYLLWVALGAVVLLLLTIVGIFNSLIAKKNQVKKVFGGLDALLKKRWDLIPNLVATVSRYARHEAEVLENLTKLRSQGQNPSEAANTDVQLTRALGGLRVAVENYPDLKANQNFLQLQGSLNEVEEQISAGRRAYNAAVEEYNNALEMFPSNMFAAMMGLKKEAFFEITAAERQNVDVRQLFQSDR